jgi:hypothetical protein
VKRVPSPAAEDGGLPLLVPGTVVPGLCVGSSIGIAGLPPGARSVGLSLRIHLAIAPIGRIASASTCAIALSGIAG